MTNDAVKKLIQIGAEYLQALQKDPSLGRKNVGWDPDSDSYSEFQELRDLGVLEQFTQRSFRLTEKGVLLLRRMVRPPGFEPGF